MNISDNLLEKHKIGIEAARNYYVKSLPTGLSDQEYDQLEREARADGLELRDFVYQEIQGTRAQNASYIPKVEKNQVQGSMVQALQDFEAAYEKENNGEQLYWIPKYDGSSLAAYYNPQTGKCMRVVTIGGTNLGGEGIDQTEKFIKYFPDTPGTGICALQSECLISLEKGFAEKSRQKANGLVNAKFSSYPNLRADLDSFIALRCFRYFIDQTWTLPVDYKAAMESLKIVRNPLSGDINFSHGLIMTFQELMALGPEVLEKDIWKTPTGTFMVDGIVAYTKSGVCVKALKYRDAGRGEATTVQSIKWNNNIVRGKDSWSANAIIDPVMLRGSRCTKPTVGSVKKMVETGVSKGAKVTLILANSTIPQIANVLSPGNLDFEWPTCSCGYKMGQGDIYGSLLKCGNPVCSERLGRMRDYLKGVTTTGGTIDLNKLLVIDRFDWTTKTNHQKVLEDLHNILVGLKQEQDLEVKAKATYDYLEQYLSTDLQKRTLALVCRPATVALSEII